MISSSFCREDNCKLFPMYTENKGSDCSKGKCSSDLKRGVSNHKDGEVLMYAAWGGCRIAVSSVFKEQVRQTFPGIILV